MSDSMRSNDYFSGSEHKCKHVIIGPCSVCDKLSVDVEALWRLVDAWRQMAEDSFADGPIPGDEIGHASRWTAVEVLADQLAALLPPRPQGAQ